MAKDDSNPLGAIRTFPQLVKYLRDELGWPIESDDFEELTFDWDPATELGLDAKTAAKVQEVKQLRPFLNDQSWGIFFVKFEPKRLPVVALRRLLARLVVRNRASARKSERAAWKLHDLLFISQYGEGDHRQISFAHFADEDENLPTLRVVGWDGDDTKLKLDHVHRELTTKMRFAPADRANVDAWRDRWSSAFTLRVREVVKTSRELAVALAQLAQRIRRKVNAALEIETERGPLRKLMAAFREGLIHDLTEDDFADMYAQTISYGLLSARISRYAGPGEPGILTADNLTDMVPLTNPFLRDLFQTFLHVGGRRNGAGRNGHIDFDELGVSEVVELLRAAQMDAVLRDFGRRNPQEDPVIHFYEWFLREYDRKKRMQRGVFYTPKPVVSYIVRSVHELLQTEFGLKDGLADTTTWGQMLRKHKGLKLPTITVLKPDSPDLIDQPIDPATPFVQILDPAVGTATFLVEVIDVIHRTMVAKWKKQGHTEMFDIPRLWNEYVPVHLLPRLHGYELMMAPYAIAHMKIGLKLFETGYKFGSGERARVYLTNALEPPQDFSDTFEQMAPALAHEAKAVNDVKRHQRFTVVIGNPPYSVSSWNTGTWITGLAEDYKRTVRLEESQIQALSNDYIKFLRLAEWQIEQARSGIVGMITGHGYLHGTQPRDLRDHLSSTFARCLCLDLHGSIRRIGTDDAEDEPVFEIMTGVAIIVASAKSVVQARGVAALSSLTGRLASKFAYLTEKTAVGASFECAAHKPAPRYFHFAPASTAEDVATEYQQWPDLPDIFGTGNRQADKETSWATGFASQQDDLAMSFSRAEVKEKMEALAASHTFDELNDKYRLCTTNQWNYDEAKRFARRGDWQEHVGQVAYRPFDRRWTVRHKNVLTILRNHVMSQLTGRSAHNLALICSRAVNDLVFGHCFVTNEPVDKIFISSKTSTNAYVFPLFVGADGLHGRQRRPNFSQRFLGGLAGALSAECSTEHAVPEGMTPREILGYIYAVLHSPSYRRRYREFLKVDFPRVPRPGGLRLFGALARLGSELMDLHLLEAPPLGKSITTYVGPSGPEMEKVSYVHGTVWLDKKHTCGFAGVPEAVWNFHIGGYQVCHKWLKDRKGRTLSKDDIAHYQKIVVAISETIRIMAEIDRVIDKHGGWPGAFVT